MSFEKSLQKEVVGMKEAAPHKVSVKGKSKAKKSSRVDDILLALSSDLKQVLQPEVSQPVVRSDPEGIKSATKALDGVPKNAKKKKAVVKPGQLADITPEQGAIRYAKNMVEDNPGLGGVLTPNYDGQKKDLELYFQSLKAAPDVSFLPKKDPLELNRNKTIEADKKDVPVAVQKAVSGKAPFSQFGMLQSLGIF